ncbi:MAG: metallophosphoesterase [Parachlamydiaceae bacterium]|nr:metallophosphoesterase [Parachlamydiaceae bacterium]
MDHEYGGLLFIGDPHLSSRIPGFRKDDYCEAILRKIEFAMQHATEHALLPIILGDLFNLPRDNSNRLLTRLMRILEGRIVLGITGNHDTTEKELQDDDSLSVIASAGRLRLIDHSGPWQGIVNKIPVYIGGTSWSERLPDRYENVRNESLVIWLTHHNIGFADFEGAWIKPQEIPGIHLIVNGHIHKPMPNQVCGMTTWMNPGSIARVARTDAVRDFIPSVVKLIPSGVGMWNSELVSLPHAPFDSVFYPMMEQFSEDRTGSAFIQGLETIQSMRTGGGAGLVQFINSNIGQFEEKVADIILKLVKEICPDEFIK